MIAHQPTVILFNQNCCCHTETTLVPDLPLPLYRLAGAWQVCPQPFEQHFLEEGQCWSEEQLSTHAAANPVAR